MSRSLVLSSQGIIFGLNLRRLVPLRNHVSSLPFLFCSLQPFETRFCLILFLVGFLLFYNYVIDVQTVQSCLERMLAESSCG